MTRCRCYAVAVTFLATTLSAGSVFAAPEGFACYLDKDGTESVLVWNAESGATKLYYVSPKDGVFKPAPYQLPPKPLGELKGARYGFDIYVDKDGNESVLVWDEKSGVGKLYYVSPKDGAFKLAPYQMPSTPLGDLKNASYGFDAYVDKDGNESVLVWDEKTGVNKLYYVSPQDGVLKPAPYQLPKKPIE